MNKPSWLLGALTGLILAAPLAAIFYLLSRLMGLAFVPFDLFEWLSRTLPGPVVIFGVETMKNGLIAAGLSVRESAKSAEQVMALAIFLLAGMIINAAYFEIRRRRVAKGDPRLGLVLGAVVGVPGMLIVSAIDIVSTAPEIVNALYTLAAFLGWGALTQWVYDRLAGEPQPVAEAGASAKSEAMSAVSVDRRRFLIQVGAASAAITVVGAGLGSVIATSLDQKNGSAALPAATPRPVPTRSPLPNMDASLQPAPGTRPELTPVAQHYRIDINLEYPEIDGSKWTLPITGLVANPLNLSLDALRKYEALDQYVTLACISNEVGGDLIGTTRWTGVSLRKVLADAKVRPEAQYLALEAADGFFESVPLQIINTDPRVMFCYAWDGQPLTGDHGFPLRIYIPNHYGMKQPKWITQAELTAQEKLGYWVVRGWDHDAIMKATSVIDTVAVNSVFTDSAGQKFIPVGGIAHAGSRSVSRVQVQVDDGDWMDAKLRKPLSDLTWVVWRYDWPMQAGDHVFTVRCVDGDGNPQIETPADVFPSGATGLFRVHGKV